MKKAMKLVWAVLFALPLIAFTSCGDDDEPILDNEGDEITLTDYSDLLNKSREDIITKKMKDFTPYYQDIDGIFYDNDGNDLGENIAEGGLLLHLRRHRGKSFCSSRQGICRGNG